MRPFDVVRFEAEIGRDRFAFDAERADMVALGDSAQMLARTLAAEYRAMADEMQNDPGLRHCDSGHAFANELKRRRGAKIWKLELRFYPADVVF